MRVLWGPNGGNPSPTRQGRGTARARLVEAYGAVPNRTQVKLRARRAAVGELAFSSEAQFPWDGRSWWRRRRHEVLRSYPGRSLGLRRRAVAIAERTR